MSSASASMALPFPVSPLALSEPLRMHRRLLIVIAVLGLHALALWAMQNGLLRRAVDQVIPVHLLADWIEPPAPPTEPRPAPPPALQKTVPAPTPHTAVTPPLPQPLAIANPSPVPDSAITGSLEPSLPAPVVASAAVAPTVPPATPSAPPRIEMPSSSADYLNNAPPPYPPLSKRMGEQGKVVVRALIEINGTASQVEVHRSSGHERLDQTALQTVLKWRYVPGKRAGVPEAMWFNIPINFVLE